MATKKRKRSGKNPTPEVWKLRQALKTLEVTNAKLSTACKSLNGEASLVLEEMYGHIQKIDKFLIELDERVSALEQENNGGQSQNTGTERNKPKTTGDAAGDI